jgi:hypothetical protein
MAGVNGTRRFHTIVPPHRVGQVDRVIIELRRRRVSYRAISEVLDVFANLEVTCRQVRNRCIKLGLETNDPRGGAR